jgi:hypothetical protein
MVSVPVLFHHLPGEYRLGEPHPLSPATGFPGSTAGVSIFT